MENFLKILVGGLLGTLALFYVLKSGKGQMRPGLEQSRNARLDSQGARASEGEGAFEKKSRRVAELEELKRQAAIARLKAFLAAVRKNRDLVTRNS